MTARVVARSAVLSNDRAVRALRGVSYVLLLLIAAPLFAASYTSSQAGNWSSASTWGGVGVPGAGDTATVNHTVTLDVPVTVAVLTLNGTITGSQPITVSTTFNWNGGTQSGTGTTTIPSGATLTLAGYGTLDARTLSIGGTLAITSSYYFYIQNNATLSNSGTVDFQGDGGIYMNGAVGTTSIANAGTIKKSAGTGTATITAPLSTTTGSQFQVNSGNFNVAAVAATSATFTVASGSTLNFNTNDTRTFDAGTTLGGAGSISWMSGTNTVSGTYSINTTTNQGGSTTIAAPASLVSLAVSGGTLTLNGTTTSISSLTMSGGTLAGTAPLSLTGAAMSWSGGTITGSGALTVSGATTITINGFVNYDTRAITNGGTFNYAGNYYSYLYNGASFTNNGTVDFQGDGGFYIGSGGSPSVVNAGTIKKSAGSGNGGLQVPLTLQSGSQLQVQSGTLYLGNVTATGATLSVSSGATAYFYYTTTSNFDAASTISGAGTVQFGAGTNSISAAYNVTGGTSASGGTTTIGSNITSLGNISSGSGSLTISNSSAPAIGNISVSGGTLTLNIPATLTIPILTMSGGSLAGTASIAVTGASMSWTGGTIGGSGTLTIPSGTTITITGAVYYDTRAITNGGNLVYSGGSYSYFYNSAAFTNNGTVDFQGDGGFYIGSGGSPSVVNNGTIKKSAGSGNGGLQVPLTLQSGSQLQVQSGSLLFGNVTATGASMSVSAGATAYFYYTTTSSFDAASSISGAGTVQFGAGTNSIAAAYNVTGTTISSGGVTTLSNITGLGNVTVSGGTLTLNSASALTIATLTMQGGTLKGTAPINLTSAAMTWTGGTIGTSGAFSIPSGTTITLSGYLYLDAVPLTNAGIINFTSSSYFYVQNNAVLTNNGTIDIQADGSIYLSGTAGTTQIVNNATIRKSGGTGSTTFNVPLTAQSGSQFNVQSGTVYLGNVTATGAALNVSSGATAYFYYTTAATFDAASSIAGAGTVQFGSGTITVSGTYNVTGTTIGSGGTTTLTNITSPGNVTVSGGTLTLNSATALSIPSLTMQGGTLNGTAPINITAAAMTWTGGTIGGSGAVNIPAGTTITLSGYVYLDAVPLTNAGIINFTSSSYIYVQNNAVLTNNGTIDIQADGSVYLNGTAGTTHIVNNGTIRKSGGTGSSTFNVPLTAQSGSQFNVQSGTVYLGNITATGASMAVSANATAYFYYTTSATFDSPSSISGAGTVQFGSGTNSIGAAYNVTGTTVGSGGTTTLSNITSTGNVTMTGGTLTLNSASALTIPTLIMQGGTLNGTAPINVTAAAMTWSGGTLGGSGTLTIPAGTTVTINSYVYFDARPVTNGGALVFTSSAYAYIQNNAVLTNNGTIDFQSDASIYLNGTAGTTSLVNNGTFKKSAGTGSSTLNVPLVAHSGSQFLVQAGNINVGDVTSTGGSFTISTGAILSFYYTSTASFDGASTISGSGNARWQNGTTTFSGTLSAPVVVSGGTLTINSAAAQSIPTLTLSGGTLNGSAAVAVTGPAMSWSGGTLGGSGTFTIPAGSTVTITNYLYFDGRPVTNSGSIIFTSGGYSYLQNNAVITNNGTIDFQADNSLYLNGTAGTTAVVNNGILKKSGGTGASTMNVPLKAQSGSQLLVQSGSIYLGDVTSTGATFNISNGATLLFYYTTTATFDAASTLSGAGTAQFQSGTNTFSGTFSAPLTMAGGTLSINSSAAQTVSWIAMTGGTLNGTAALSVSATSMNWSGGTLGGSGTLTIPSGATVTITGYPTIDTRSISNAGTFAVQSGAYFYLQNGAAITNSGLFDLQGNAAIYNNTGTVSITNSGTLRKSGATGTSASVYPPVTNGSGATLEADLGTVTFSSLTNAGTLYFPIAGATSYGKIVINGAFALSGTLSATTSGGYTPALSTSFPVLSYTSASGVFATRNLSYSGGVFTDSYSATGMALTATNGLCASAPAGIVSWWRAEGDATDVEAANNGTLNGSLTTTAGYVGQAFNFGGSSSVNGGTSTTLAPPAITVEFWANPRSFANTYNNLVARWGQSNSAQNSWVFTMYQPDNQWHWDVNTSGGPVSVAGTGGVALNQWTHIAGTYDGTTASLYVNGVLAGQANMTGTIVADPTSMMSIGCKFADGACNYGFNGLVDEVSVYNRALTASEIQSIYAVAGVAKCTPAGTITSVSPNSGPTTGGTAVTITGSGFVSGASLGVTFGGVAATSVAFTNATTITCVTPAGTAGAVNVVLTNGDGQVTTLTNGYTYSANPTITSFNPAAGSTAGGGGVVIDGTGLSAVTSVLFGSTPATIIYQSATELTVAAPAGSGNVTINVAGAGGAPASSSTQFAYSSDDDLARDYSVAANPSPRWTYGQEPTRGGSFTAFTSPGRVAGGMDAWPSSGLPVIERNSSGATIQQATNYTPSMKINMHPGTAGENAVARWTAPASGSYTIAGDFIGLDSSYPTTTDVAILHNNNATTPLFAGNIASYNVPLNFSVSVVVNAGDTIEFTVGDGGNGYFGDATGLDATITFAGACTPPSVTISASGPTTFCSGGSVTLTAPAGYSAYAWSNGATTQSINVTASGSYSVTVSSAVSCSGTSSPTTVTVNPPPATPVVTASGPTTFCAGGSVTLSAPSGFTYTWSTGATTQSIIATASGNYSLTVTDTNGCSATSAVTTVTVNPSPATPVITASGSTTFCTGGSVTLTAPSGYSSYAWSNGASTQSINVTTSGTYSVTVSNGGSCSATSAATTVTVNPLPATPVVTASGPTTFCAGGSVTLTAPSGYSSYAWSNGASTQSINVTTSGSYSVTVSSGASCSATSAATTVTVTAAPAPPVITAIGPTAFCAGGSVTLTAPSGYASYSWSNGATTQSIKVTSSGSYSVTVASGGSCSATSAATTVTVHPLPPTPIVTADGPTTFCAGGSVTLTAPSGMASYSWSNGAVTPSIAVTSSDTLTVTVTDGNGCSATSASTSVVVTQVSVSITAPAKAFPGSSQTATVAPSAAGATYQWTISNGSITNGQGTSSITFTAGATGSVSLGVTVTSSSGCAANASASVPIGASADLGVSMNASSASIISGDSITYTINVTNSGPDPATNVVVTDTMPSGTTVSSASGAGWSCTTSQPVTCTMAVLNVGPASAISVVTTPPAAASSVTNTVVVSSDASDPLNANNSASATTAINQPLCGNAAPSLSSPADGTSTTSPVTFTWGSVTNATSYELWAAIDGAPAASIGSTSATSLTVAVGGSHVEWFVGAHFGATCPVLFSTHRTLTLSTPNPCGGNAAPALISPINGLSVTSPVTFTWKAAPNATGYRVWIAVDGAPAQDVGTTDAATTTLTASVQPGSIDWYVEASFSGCPLVRSDVASFRIPRPDPCASRTASSPTLPADNSTASSALMNFQWTAVTGASGYRVWAAVDGAPFDALGTTTDTTLTKPMASGRVEWFVETLFNGCASVESAHRIFTVPKAQTCATTQATLVGPAANAALTNGSVSFAWNSVAGAIGYEVWLSLNNGTPTQIGTTNSATTLTRDVAAGSIEWFVRTNFDGCPAVDSAHAQFTYAPPPACTDARPLLSLPLNGARDIYSPVNFSWKEVGGATGYNLWISVDGAPAKLKTTVNTVAANDVDVPPGVIEWYVEAVFGNTCLPTRSTTSHFAAVSRPTGCVEPLAPVLITPASVSSDVQYSVTWQKVAGGASYTLQESSTGDFSDASTQFTSDDHIDFRHANATTVPISFYYRVRATSGCGTQPSPYSSVMGVSILPSVAAGSHLQGAMPVDSAQTLTYSIPIDASLAGLAFTASANEPWITITPTSGIVPVGGTSLTATVTTASLPVGTSLGGVTITTTPVAGSSSHARTSGGTTTTTTLSVSLVQPVLPQPKDTPPPDALIIPAVAHADGINSKFQSDVRVTNTSPQVMKYQVTFTPTGESGIKNGKQTTVDVDPGKTVALDDVLGAWFSSGAFSSLVGTLEIRPLTTVANSSSGSAVSGLANLVTFASSRTFNVTANGTFGQYIPAIPFANFIGAAQDAAKSTILSLQQVAESSAFRTNLGIVEGSGQPANVLLSIFGDNGQKLKDVAMTLQGGQHVQLNSFLGTQGLQMNDGRVEVKVTSPTGRVTAYASVLDNRTNDPLLVTPVAVNRGTSASNYVVAGVADLNNGLANWRTDMRLLNASTSPLNATLEFYSQNGGAPHTAQVTLGAGEVKQLDNLLASVFGVTNEGGALHVTTAQPSNIVATARTYNDTGHGTYGQFISAVTANDGASSGSRPLQLLQVEESDRFRTNVGIAEISGKPVKVQISLVPPDSRVTANVVLDLGANEFRQLNSLVKQLGLTNVYNARVSIQVIGGQGRVTAYASVIDAVTQDPTFVPAQ